MRKECSFYGDMIGTTGEDLPFWLGFPPYAACCVFGLSWPYRHYFSKRAVRGDFVFEKSRSVHLIHLILFN